MQNLKPADELSEIRATLVRLQAREASLCAALQQETPTLPKPRPGWPIRRKTEGLH
ncbi:hypothetical protein [Cypionkella sp. TWP1-2-1b2]|uniref:hypothetical protein n=1 Tax=Cypionkella sp. TWP1-2-1b2 TaxID=2804675 RepID=UPI003CF84DAD